MARWTDDPVTRSTRVRAVHINELRRVVSYYRQQAGLSPISWTDGTLTNSTHIRAIHFTELRSAIQDLWTYHGLGNLPNWSVGNAPSNTRQVSARDTNDLRSWVNSADPPLNLWTGFHWCSPLNNLPGSAGGNTGLSSNGVAQDLLDQSERWGTVIICSPSNGLDGGFQDAVDRAASTISSLGDTQLDQCIVRIYNPSLPTFTDYLSAINWIQPYIANLNYFTDKGGANLVLFNELNVAGEPQQNINPITLALIAAAFRDTYTIDQVRTLYILFPGPGGDALANSGLWNSYWDTYDLRNTTTHSNPKTFDAYYGSGVDGRLDGQTMLWHGGTGIFDRVALHCYAPDPTTFATDDPTTNPALQVIQWYLNPPAGSGAAVVDTTGWCYVTECGGQSSTVGPDYGDSAAAGAALASFEAHANARYTVGNSYGNPALLQAIYGYILDYSNSGATHGGIYEIGNVSGMTPTSAYLDAYNAARSFP